MFLGVWLSDDDEEITARQRAGGRWAALIDLGYAVHSLHPDPVEFFTAPKINYFFRRPGGGHDCSGANRKPDVSRMPARGALCSNQLPLAPPGADTPLAPAQLTVGGRWKQDVSAARLARARLLLVCAHTNIQLISNVWFFHLIDKSYL